VAEHFAGGRDAAARRLGEQRKAMEAAEARLQQLRDYADGYRADFDRSRARGLSAAKLNNYVDFLAQLQEALGQQAQQVERARADFETQRARWQEAHGQVRAVEKAADRREMHEQRSAERAEQRLQDELSLARISRGADQ
jgi:flagellar FliJ protein